MKSYVYSVTYISGSLIISYILNIKITEMLSFFADEEY